MNNTRLQHENKEKNAYKILIKKAKRITIFLLESIPILILLLLYYVFLTQKSRIYKKCLFTDFNLELLNSAILSNKIFLKTKSENFDVYIIDNKSETDFIYFHGSRIKKENHLIICNELSKITRYNIIIPFYRGYGTSYGQPSEMSIMEDMHLLKKMLVNRKNVQVLFGQSLGCATALYFSDITGFSGKIVLENPFFRMRDVVTDNGFFNRFLGFIVTEKWNNYLKIKRVCGQILFLVSENDRLVRRKHFDGLSRICRNSQHVIIKDATHFNAYKKPEYYLEIFKFLKQY